MIRLSKPVQLLEWGEGTNTTNQRWIELGTGKIITKPKFSDGITTILVQLDGKVAKQNPQDDTIKMMQKGEGMTPCSDKWGEVAYGRIRNISSDTGNSVVELEVKTAVKHSR